MKGGTNAQVTRGPATSQTTPGGSRLAVIGLVLGLLVGLFISVGRRVLDSSIRSRRALERATGQRVLGLIPKVVDWDPDQIQNVALAHPTSPPAEAYRTLRTPLRFLTVDGDAPAPLHERGRRRGQDHHRRNIGVTSPAPASVLLVDADLRKPRLHEFSAVRTARVSPPPCGADVADPVRPVDGMDCRWVLTAGGPMADSSEHLGSDRAAEVFAASTASCRSRRVRRPTGVAGGRRPRSAGRSTPLVPVAPAGRTKPKEARLAAELITQVGAARRRGAERHRLEMGEGYAFEYGYDLEDRAAGHRRRHGRFGTVAPARRRPPGRGRGARHLTSS